MFKSLRYDLPAGIVSFLVAMPLCLGIALAAGAPLFSGLVSGVIGGVVVGALSGSALGVSGTATGLAVVVSEAIINLGSFPAFLVALTLAGLLQIAMGFARAGIVAYFLPSSVIHGMLTGMGGIIFLKQLPHALGYDKDPEGDMNFIQLDGHNTLSEIFHVMGLVHWGVVVISVASLFILLLWNTQWLKKLPLLKAAPGPLVVVACSIALERIFSTIPSMAIGSDHLVNIPTLSTLQAFMGNFVLPDFSALANPGVYTTAIVIALVASLETLFCAEAADKQDPFRRITPTNRELKAQGVGNVLAGLIGGLPIAQAIARTSTNQQAGAKSKLATIMHGVLLLLSVTLFSSLLNMIPMGALASILLVVGYKMINPALVKRMYSQGIDHFMPFLVTALGIFFSNLLVGVGIGLVVALSIILRNNFKIPYSMERQSLKEQEVIHIELSQDVTFLNKAAIINLFEQMPDNSKVVIDASNTLFIHQDILEIIEDFKINADVRNIEVQTIDLYENKQAEAIRRFSLRNSRKEKSQIGS